MEPKQRQNCCLFAEYQPGCRSLCLHPGFLCAFFTFDFEHFSAGAGHDEMNTMCCVLGSEIVNSFPKMTISDTKTIDIVHLVWYHR